MHYLAPETRDGFRRDLAAMSVTLDAREDARRRRSVDDDDCRLFSSSLLLFPSLSRCAPPREYVGCCGLVRATETQDETSVGHFTGGIIHRGSSRLRVEHHWLRKSILGSHFYCKIPMRSRGDTRSAHGQRSYGIRVRVYREWKKKKRPLSLSLSLTRQPARVRLADPPLRQCSNS